MNIRIKYIADNGDTAEFTPSSLKLLSYSDLTKTISENCCDLEFMVTAGNSQINETVIEKDSTASFEITFHKKQTIYALTIGGWCPFPFLPESTILADRNVIDTIKKLMHEKEGPFFEASQWWFKFTKNYNLTINPVLYAFEGKNKRTPSFEEFCSEYDEAVNIINSTLPSIKTTTYKSIHYEAAYKLLLDKRSKFSREADFLISVAPLVVSRHSTEKLKTVQNEINNLAKQYNLIGNSLSYILAISCLYENKDGSGYLATRKIFKPKDIYTKEMAFNTLTDLLNLEFLLNIQGLFNNAKQYLCTCDTALAVFWAGLAPRDLSSNNGQLSFNFSLDSSLFPRLSVEEQHKLCKEIQTL